MVSASALPAYERDLSHMVQGPTFLSLTALSGTRWQKRSADRNLVVHRQWYNAPAKCPGGTTVSFFSFLSLFQPFCLKHAM